MLPSSTSQQMSNPSGVQQEERPSPYQTLLESAPSDYLTNLEGAVHDLPPEYPVYYFFYGTLKAPETMKRILGLADEPKLRSAQIVGYALGKWGDYPALINGEPGQIISGITYLVQSEEQAQKLAYYETKAYKVSACWIFFTDGDSPAEEAPGKTFMYAGDEKALLEQRFDRKLWALQMGDKLGESH